MTVTTAQVAAAAIYCRISQDRGGEGLGVQRQERLCRDLADRRGWAVAELYIDNDVSAYTGRARPAYDRMLRDLASGARNAVIVVDTDRLTRHPRELEDFIVLADRLGVALANVSGDLDLATSDGRFRARIMGAVARQESEKKSERLQRQRAQAARLGRPHGGRRAFGYDADGMTVRPDEADRIREAARRVLAGDSLRAVARDWNAAGVTSASGGQWTIVSLRTMLTGARLAGLRVHRGEVIGDAAWPGILDRDERERLVAALGNPRARKQGRPPANLLTGMLVCGRCGATLHSSRRVDGSRRYVCNSSPGKAGCGRLAVQADPLERHVTEVVLAALAGPGLNVAIRQRGESGEQAALLGRLRHDEEALEQLATDHYADGTISRRQFFAASDALEQRIAATRRALSRAADQTILAAMPTTEEALRDAWDARDLDWRRAVLGAVVERVTVGPGWPGRRPFDSDRISITWRG